MNKEKEFKFLSSGKSFIVIWSIFIVGGYILLTFVYISGQNLPIFWDVIGVFMLGVLPILVFIFGANYFLSVVYIDEEGIKRRLFGKFFERKITWEELYELRPYYLTGSGLWLYASRIDLTEYNYREAMRNKKVIRLVYTPESIYAIRTFCDKEILGVPEEEIDKIIQTHIEGQGKKGKN